MELTPVLALSAVQLAILVVALVLLSGLIVGFYTRTGSGIEQRRFGKRRTSNPAPGAAGPSEISGKDEGGPESLSRGTDATA